MRWTTTPPAAPGWYWHRQAETAGPPRVVQVIADPAGLFVRGLLGQGDLTLRTVAAHELTPGEWAGPLPEPADA